MSTTSIGNVAEEFVAQWLMDGGYTVIARNWRTRWCEIDIIAQKEGIVYFVEVRHRKTNGWGDGIDSITTKKYQQMQFAAEMWIHSSNWSGDARIAVVATSGRPLQINSFTEV